jgi:hypothetical protein
MLAMNAALRTLAALLAFLALVTSCGPRAASQLEVTYYYLPG